MKLFLNLIKFKSLKNRDKFLLLKSKILEIINYYHKQKLNIILYNSKHNDLLFIKYLKNYYYQNNRTKKIFLTKHLFSFSNIKEKSEILNLINSIFPQFRSKVEKRANEILSNTFRIFNIKYKFQDKIDWNHSFYKNKKWPLKKSSDIDFSPNQDTPDIKNNWEFNRHSFLETLALSYYLTNHEKYSKKILDLILDWIDHNPPGYYTGWMDILEVAMRLKSWIFSLNMIKHSSEFSKCEFFKIFKSMFQHVFYIFNNIEKNACNHTIGEYFGIYLFSYIYNEIKSINCWYKKSFKQLKHQFSRQTLIDGVNFEKSINYHRVVLEFFSLFLILEPNSLTKKEKTLLSNMYTFLMFNIKPNREVPLIGDFDDAHVIPHIFFNNSNNYFYEELLTLGSILFNRGDLKFINKKISLPSILLTGLDGFSKFKKLKAKKSKNNYYYFKYGGYFIARNNYDNNSNFLIFDMADFGPYGSHDHFDISNIIYSYKGKPVLIDSGTYRYNIDLSKRNIFKDIEAHNVLNIINFKKIKSINTFGWNKLPKLKRKCIELNNHFEFELLHNSFKFFTVLRRIIASKDLTNVKIFDFIYPDKNFSNEVKLNLNFHFPKDTILHINENKEIIMNDLNKIIINTENILRLKINKESYFISSKYGEKYLTPLIKIEALFIPSKNKPLMIKTQIIPLS